MLMKEFVPLAACVLSLNIVLIECTSSIRNVDGDVVVGEKGKHITLRWNVFNFPVPSGIESHLMRFFYKSITVDAVSLGNTLVEQFNKTLSFSITSRLSSGRCFFPNENGTCEITISNLEYEDSGPYFAVYVFGGVKASQNVTLEVKGGAELCGSKRLPQNFTCSDGETVYGNVTICGKPKPVVTWKIEDQMIEDINVDESLASQHQYTYSFQLKTNYDMCGKRISYHAAGFKNITGSTVVLKRDSDDKDTDDDKNVGAIVGGVVGGLVVIIIIIVIIVLVKKGKIGGRRSASTEPKDEDQHMSTEKA